MKGYCGKCQQDTNHHIIYQEVINYRDEYYADEYYMIIKCNGCDHISFRKDFHDIEGAYPGDGDEWIIPKTVETYPKVIRDHSIIREMFYVPKIVKETYEQSVTAYREGANILAGLGFRSVIEAICNDQNIQGRTLERRINRMSELGIISKGNSKLLHAIRFLGNDAAHEIKSPTENALRVTLTIVEHVILSVYILESKANEHIDTILDTLDELKLFIDKSLKPFNSGDEVPLAQILGKDIRRFLQDLSKLEIELIKSITDGTYIKLKVGKVDYFKKSSKLLQHFIVV